MGQARLRGPLETRRQQAIKSGRIKASDARAVALLRQQVADMGHQANLMMAILGRLIEDAGGTLTITGMSENVRVAPPVINLRYADDDTVTLTIKAPGGGPDPSAAAGHDRADDSGEH